MSIPIDTENIVELSVERALELMAERAQKLARVEVGHDTDGDLEVAIFNLASEKYAIEARVIREITPYAGCARVPGAPDLVAGLINLHGQIVALFDLRKLFGLPVKGVTEATRIIVLGSKRTEFAIVVDSVECIVKLNRTQLHDAPDGKGAGREHILGVTLDALIVLDGNALMEDKRFYVNQSEG